MTFTRFDAEKRTRAIVKAATHFNDPKVLLEVSEDLAGAMKGLAVGRDGRGADAANQGLVERKSAR